MSTDHHPIDRASYRRHSPAVPTGAGHGYLSLLPLAGAAAAVALGGPLAWPAAASLLAVAYLAAFLELRRGREG